MPSRLCDPPWRGYEEFYSVQGAGRDQLVDSSGIGWHQGEVSSIINQPSGFNQSRVCVLVVSSFPLAGVCFLYKQLRNVCQAFIPFRELGVG